MTNIQIFKRFKGQWVLRPTGGADRNPGLKPSTQEWLKSPFARQLLNKHVSVLGSCHGTHSVQPTP